MNYEQFFLLELFSEFSTEPGTQGVDHKWDLAPKLYEKYKESVFYRCYGDHKKGMVKWIETLEWKQSIICDCGNTEDIDVEDRREFTESFEWVSDSTHDGTNYFKCTECGVVNKSEFITEF